MKVLNLRCDREHRFEGWFASELDFQSQVERRVLACPVCNSKAVVRLPSAPRVHLTKLSGPTSPQDVAATVDPEVQAQARWLQAVRQVLERTEDVGERFPEEARRIHYGETMARGIRGQASGAEAQALKEEGIEVAALVMPEPTKGPVQ